MPQFSFHFASKDHFLLDEIGKELESLHNAHAYALKMIRHIQSILPDEENWLGWSVNITDEFGQGVLTVLFPSPERHSGWVPPVGRGATQVDRSLDTLHDTQRRDAGSAARSRPHF